jgi:VWFA-related protein
MKMSKTIKNTAAIFVLGAALALPLRFSAQQTPEPVPGVIRINVNLVQVDAVVTDSQGRPITNLKADDFEVLQDGKAQKIRNFEFVRVNDPLKSLVVSPRVPPSSSLAGSPPPPPALADKVRRTVALVVDDLALSFDGTVRVRNALLKWIDTEMQPGDLVSIVRTNAAMGALQQFTNDKRLLRTAIDHVRYQPGRVNVAGFRPFDPGLGANTAPDTSMFDAEVENNYLIASYNAIRYVINGLRELPGRKSMVLFSEDLSLPSADSTLNQRQSIEERLRQLADDANRSSVVIYAVDVRGSRYAGLTAEDNLTGRAAENVVSMTNGRMDGFVASQDGMALLAQRTGGLFISGNNDLSNTLRKTVDDGDGYYLLGYQPEGSTFELLKSDALRYHSIKVRLKRPGLNVRSRSGFYGLSDARPAPAATQTPQAQLAKALVSPFTTGDIRVRLTALFAHSEKEGSSVKTLLHFDAHDLKFKEESDGSHTAVVDIAVVTFDENGELSQRENKTWTIRVTAANYEGILNNGLLYTMPIAIKNPGPYQLRVAIRDAATAKLGSAMQFLDIPNVKAGQLALSGIVIARDPILRRLKAGDALSYAYEVFNPRKNGEKKSQIETQARLYREGEVIYDGVPTSLTATGDKDRIPVGGSLELRRIPAGEYVLQVIVADKLRKDRSGVVGQTIDFEVRP